MRVKMAKCKNHENSITYCLVVALSFSIFAHVFVSVVYGICNPESIKEDSLLKYNFFSLSQGETNMVWAITSGIMLIISGYRLLALARGK